MDNNLKKFIAFSILIVSFFFLIILFFIYFYRYSTINTYNYILLILIMLTIIVTLSFIFASVAIFYTYQKKRSGSFISILAGIGMKVLLPFIMFASGLFKNNKDFIRKIYIDVNNILVESRGRKYLSKEVLLLLPHCLQFSGCGYKVTNGIENCKRCGRCCIAKIAELVDNTGITVAIVTGGTIARKIISSTKPKLILSVACERDLTSGISDVGNIPVIGMLNDRPNGPCVNTTVDVKKVEEKLKSVLRIEN